MSAPARCLTTAQTGLCESCVGADTRLKSSAPPRTPTSSPNLTFSGRDSHEVLVSSPIFVSRGEEVNTFSPEMDSTEQNTSFEAFWIIQHPVPSSARKSSRRSCQRSNQRGRFTPHSGNVVNIARTHWGVERGIKIDKVFAVPLIHVGMIVSVSCTFTLQVSCSITSRNVCYWSQGEVAEVH